MSRAFCGLLLGGALVLGACRSAADGPRVAEPPPKPPIDLYLVPLGPLPGELLEELAIYYRSVLGLEVLVARNLLPPPSSLDPRRKQLVAEELTKALRERSVEAGYDTGLVLGLTRADLYIRRYDWDYAFGYRDGGRHAVVSAARLDPRAFGEEPDEKLLLARLRKLITKNVGLLLFDLSTSEDPTSVLRGGILSLDDLDLVEELSVARDVLAAGSPRRLAESAE